MIWLQNNHRRLNTTFTSMELMTKAMLPLLRKASDAVLDIYQDESRFGVDIKDDNSPLTAADRVSNEIIRETLHELFPGIPVISEESKYDDYRIRSKYDTYFLVDPLDGTKEFIKRNGEFTINIAFMQGSSPVAGFVFVPASGLAYVAHRGHGGFLIDEQNVETSLRSKPFFLMDKGLGIVASRSHRDEATDNIINKLNEPVIKSSGSSLKFLLIAQGLAHFYPRLAPTMEWDTAAAQCILEESGGSVLQAETLEPVVYNKENLLNPHFLAIGALLDPERLKSILDGW